MCRFFDFYYWYSLLVPPQRGRGRGRRAPATAWALFRLNLVVLLIVWLGWSFILWVCVCLHEAFVETVYDFRTQSLSAADWGKLFTTSGLAACTSFVLCKLGRIAEFILGFIPLARKVVREHNEGMDSLSEQVSDVLSQLSGMQE